MDDGARLLTDLFQDAPMIVRVTSRRDVKHADRPD